MSLWDALTGRIANWNKVKEESNVLVYGELRKFYLSSLQSDLQRYKDSVDLAIQILICNYSAIMIHLSKELDEPNVPYLSSIKQRLFALNLHGYLDLCRAVHMGNEMALRHKDNTRLGSNNLLIRDYLVDGIIAMYRAPIHYRETWDNRLAYIYDKKLPESGISSRLSMASYDDIQPILGLPTNNIRHGLWWFEFGVRCMNTAKRVFEGTTSGEVIQELLTTHCRE